jgi:hypothetical protein
VTNADGVPTFVKCCPASVVFMMVMPSVPLSAVMKPSTHQSLTPTALTETGLNTCTGGVDTAGAWVGTTTTPDADGLAGDDTGGLDETAAEGLDETTAEEFAVLTLAATFDP